MRAGSNGHPSDRHHGARLKPRAQVDRGVHSHFAAPSEHGAVEDRGTGGHEHLVLERRAGDMCVRPDQAVVPDRTGMLGARPNHGVFHDDPVAPDPDGATGLTDEARAVQDAHARSNRDVAAQRRIGCYPGGRVDRWTLSRMLNQHRLAYPLSPRPKVPSVAPPPFTLSLQLPNSMASTHRPGSQTCSRGCPIIPPSGSPNSCPGIGARKASPQQRDRRDAPPALIEVAQAPWPSPDAYTAPEQQP